VTTHRRRFESFDKLSMYVAGISLTTLMGMQVNLTNKLSETSVKNQIELTVVTTKMTSVIKNQDALRGTVGTIRVQMTKMCERQKKYWPEHRDECR